MPRAELPSPPHRRVWSLVLDADRLVRLHFLFFSCLWPLLGVVSVRRDPSPGQLAAVLLVGVGFHIYAFVLNDVIDLPLDRTQPLRQDDPLVRGAISRNQALALACLQPLLVVPPTLWLGGGARALAILGFGFAAMGAYNLWGKRCPVPPFTDLIQGLAWGSLAIFAACALQTPPTAVTWMVAAYAVGYTLFMNGVHGGLRDLANDLDRGARTTAIFFGARPAPAGGAARVPKAIVIFTSSALASLVGINAALVFRNDFGYGPVTLAGTAMLMAALNAAAVGLLAPVMRPGGAAWGMAFRLQIYLVLISLPVAFLGAASAPTLVVLAALKAISLSVLEWTTVILRWVRTTVRGALPAAASKPLDSGVVSIDQ